MKKCYIKPKAAVQEMRTCKICDVSSDMKMNVNKKEEKDFDYNWIN